MIKLEAKEDVKRVKNYSMFLKLENFALNVPEWNQKSREFYINNADYIITNNDTIDNLKERFNNLYKTLNDE